MTQNTLAFAGTDSVDGGSRAATIVRYLDLPVLALALPVFILAGFPMLGYAVLAAAWLVGAAIEAYGRNRSVAELAGGNRRGAMGWASGTMLGRVYLVTTAVLLVGLLADREDGLAAAVLAVVLFTVHFIGRFIAKGIDPDEVGA